jgi:hypothetical protein
VGRWTGQPPLGGGRSTARGYGGIKVGRCLPDGVGLTALDFVGVFDDFRRNHTIATTCGKHVRRADTAGRVRSVGGEPSKRGAF